VQAAGSNRHNIWTPCLFITYSNDGRKEGKRKLIIQFISGACAADAAAAAGWAGKSVG
jgi:hypothetical protein